MLFHLSSLQNTSLMRTVENVVHHSTLGNVGVSVESLGHEIAMGSDSRPPPTGKFTNCNYVVVFSKTVFMKSSRQIFFGVTGWIPTFPSLRFTTSGAVTVVPILQSCELRSFLSCRAVCREWHGHSVRHVLSVTGEGAMNSCMIIGKRITSMMLKMFHFKDSYS